MTVGLQLYSMRDYPDQIGLLAKLPQMGISEVEGYGGVYGDPVGYRAAMDANGITMPAGHMALDDIEADFDACLKLANTLGMHHVFAPYLDEAQRPTTSQGYAELAARLASAGKSFADAGLTFGWHNHDFEFVALADGGIPMDIILTEAPDIRWEADLAWIVRGGRDPAAYVANYGSRLRSIHVKDIAPAGTHEDEDGWCDLGDGTMDWTGLLRACRAQSDHLHFMLEHDKPSDPEGYASRSAAAFKAMWETTNG